VTNERKVGGRKEKEEREENDEKDGERGGERTAQWQKHTKVVLIFSQ
jgi:hypothetical protein